MSKNKSIVKLVLPDGEIRRLVLEAATVEQQFAELQQHVASLLTHGAEYTLTYKDEEGDTVTLGQHAGELADALLCAEKLIKKLRLTVTLRNASQPKPVPKPVPKPAPVPEVPVTKERLTGRELLRRCLTYAETPSMRAHLRRHGKVCTKVAWEDTARHTYSSLGPNACDLTLVVNKQAMPIIRAENFRDLTGDVPMHQMRIVVGNHKRGTLRRVSLAAVLRDLSLVANVPSGTSVFADSRDSHFLASPQTCLLPVAPRGHTDFCARIRSITGPVLTLVCTEFGTSARLLHRGQTSDLTHNAAGTSHMLRAVRLSEKRRREGRPSGAMTAREKASQVVLIVQVPLMERPGAPIITYQGRPCAPSVSDVSYGAAPLRKRSVAAECYDDSDSEEEGAEAVEAAQLCVGRRIGPFPASLAQLTSVTDTLCRPCGPIHRRLRVLQRDTRHPVRVTVQFYRCSGTGRISPSDIDEIVAEQQRVFDNADFVGSLVTGEVVRGTTGPLTPPDNWFDRPIEPTPVRPMPPVCR
ncbi:MAG: hypothetical protein MHM6MM_007038 [Cercozoa sp. M6MM]